MIPLISIILPIYNKELYIYKCIHSILVQSYKNFELIIRLNIINIKIMAYLSQEIMV